MSISRSKRLKVPDLMTSFVTIIFSNRNLLPGNDNLIPAASYYNNLAVIGLTPVLPHHRTVCERLVFSVRYALWPKSFLMWGGGFVCQAEREAEETIEHRACLCNTTQRKQMATIRWMEQTSGLRSRDDYWRSWRYIAAMFVVAVEYGKRLVWLGIGTGGGLLWTR